MITNLKKMVHDGFSGLGWFIWFLVFFSLITKQNFLGLETYVNVIIALYPLASILVGSIFSFISKDS